MGKNESGRAYEDGDSYEAGVDYPHQHSSDLYG
jgi:hypothetical protein